MKNQNEIPRSTQLKTNTKENEHLLMLPYKGKVGETTRKSLRNTLKSVIPANNTSKSIYTGTKLASKFNIKDKIRKEHKHDLIYKAQCLNLNCDETHIGEIGRGFSERIIDHSGRDDKSHLYEHEGKTGHENVNIDHFEILSNGLKNKFKRKLAQTLHIKHEIPTLNVQIRTIRAIKVVQLKKYRGVVGTDYLLRWSFLVKSVNCFSCELFPQNSSILGCLEASKCVSDVKFS